MISTNQFKGGMVIKMENELYYIVSFQHIKPGKGGAFVRTKLRNLKLGTVIDRTFRSGETFEEAFIDQRKLQFMYKSGHGYHFLDMESYEQMDLNEDTLEDCVKYLKENSEVTALIYDGKIIGVQPPMFVILEVTETEPGIKGDTAKSGTKPAKVESGAVVHVPLFIQTGDIIKIDTRTGEYVERAK